MNQIQKILTELGLIAAFTALGLACGKYLTPFVIAALLAVIIDPAVEWASRKGLPRPWASLLALTLVAVLLLGLIVGGVTRLALEANQLLESWPEYQGQLQRLSDEGLERFATLYARIPKPILTALEADQTRLYAGVSGFFRGLVGVVKGAPSFLLVALVTVLATFFISRDKRLILRAITSVTPRAWRSRMTLLRQNMGAALAGFLRAQLLLITLTAVLAVIGLLLIRVKYAWMLGLLAGFFDLIPMVGPSGVFLPTALYYLISGQPLTAMAVVVALAVILVVRQILEPRILGASVGLHPLVTLIAVYLGFRLFGAAGFFVGPITAIFLKAVLGLTVYPLLRED